VIQKELAERNLQHLSVAYKKWVKDYRTKLKKERGWI
jgi:hypothetical protein